MVAVVALLVASLLATITFLPAPGAALRCWVCSSDEDRYCADPLNTTDLWLSECVQQRDREYSSSYTLASPPHFPVCKKVKQRERGILVYIRSCGFEDYSGSACTSEDSGRYGDHVEYCDSCTSDGCNAAHGLHPGVVHHLSLMVALGILMVRAALS